MSFLSLSIQSFRYYWRNHLGLLFGAFLASAILSGSLVVGDSVRASLRKIAEQRLGSVHQAIIGGDRWFSEDLAAKLKVAPVIMLNGAVSAANGEARANAIQVLGVEEKFWQFGESKQPIHIGDGEVALNESLAQQLAVKIGDTVVIRFETPSAISRDAPLSGDTNQEITLRRKVSHIVSSEQFGNFQLQAAQIPPSSVFVPIKDIQTAVEKERGINLMLAVDAWQEQGEDSMASKLNHTATLQDYALQLKRVEGSGKEWEISTDRVFLDEALAEKIMAKMPGSRGVLTYLVNGLSSTKSQNRTPYSMVSAVDSLVSAQGAEGGGNTATITQWLADDLSLAVGDTFELRYFTVGIGRELQEQTAEFKVANILPMDAPDVNRSWTPNFPGVSDVDNCRDWQPGIPVKLDAIRDKDEDYWDTYRGTPKAFISLAVGQELWGNRFGHLTSIRFADTGQDEAALARQITQLLSFADIGIVPRNVQADAGAAAKGSVDFGGLFIGLSLFLIAAALVFSALLFLFTLERRISQMGLLLAIGWTPKMVRKTILLEAGVVAAIGSALGLLGGMFYTKAALAGLNGVWSGATVGLTLFYQASPLTQLIAFVASLIASLGTLWWVSRRLFKAPARDLLVGTWRKDVANGRGKKQGWLVKTGIITPLLCLILALVLAVLGSRVNNPQAMAGMFFGAGFLLLAGGLIFIRQKMLTDAKATDAAAVSTNMREIAVRNITRRPGRSLAVIGMMAGGIFLVIAVNAFRLGTDDPVLKRDSGTGGFALMGQSSLPIYEDLNSEATWETFALDEKLMANVKVVPFRMKAGDDASCLNLNRAQQPVLTAVNARAMADRKAFKFASGSWDTLLPSSPEQCAGHSRTDALTDKPIAAIADQATAMWGLGKGVGDTLEYTDANGRTFKVELTGLLAGSVLQGKIIVNEADYLRKYPDAAGYQFFMVDVASVDEKNDTLQKVQAHLIRQLETRGLALESTQARLAAFNAVQNTYIGIFTVLGGLGVLLGTAGLGVLALRNVLERRGEFGLMQALGFRQGALRRMIFNEHATLLVLGLVLGLASAALAVWPNIQQSGGELPVTFVAILSVAILAFGLLICWLAGAVALRGKMLDAIRRE